MILRRIMSMDEATHMVSMKVDAIITGITMAIMRVAVEASTTASMADIMRMDLVLADALTKNELAAFLGAYSSRKAFCL